MIQLQGVYKSYQQGDASICALDNIDLSVAKGRVAGVIGQSGAGKSTLIRCINLLERPTRGTVNINGQILTAMNPAELRKARAKIGMIFQQFNLLNALSVFDNVALPLRLAKKKSSEIFSIVSSLLELVGLSDKSRAYPAQLSGGQKQRVAIARALAMQPELLLCDEATSALDPANTEAILQLIRKINQDLGLTVLLITHEMQVIKQICDQVIVLEAGKIIEQGQVAEVFAHPQQPVTRHFVNSALKAELPFILQEKISANPAPDAVPVWRIYFRGHAAAEPVIADLVRNLGLRLNIMQASLECIQHYTVGIMFVAVENPEADMQAGMAYLLGKGLEVEVMGYVARNAL